MKIGKLSKRVYFSKLSKTLPKFNFIDVHKISWADTLEQFSWSGRPIYKAMWNECRKAKVVHKRLVKEGHAPEFTQAPNMFTIKLYGRDGKLLTCLTSRDNTIFSFSSRYKARKFYDQVDLLPLPFGKEPIMWNSGIARININK